MKKRIIVSVLIFLSVLFSVGWHFFLSAPNDFPSGAIVEIKRGLSLSATAEELEKNGIIKSVFGFKVLAKISNKTKIIKSGEYLFKDPVSVFGVIARLAQGSFGFGTVKVFFPEGFANDDIAELFGDFKNFNKEEFLTKAKEFEGYLFPDTYLFLPSADEDQIIREMKDNFLKKAGRVERDIVIIASLIEKEVPKTEDRNLVSGVFWKRLEIGMPLQVDAVFPYITGRNEVTLDDYKIKSPYNTYLNKGLPPGPISNPGLDAILTALNPKESPYLFYLSGRDGKTHFAKTYDEHLANREKYLR